MRNIRLYQTRAGVLNCGGISLYLGAMQINISSQKQIKIFALTKRNRKSKHERARYRNPLYNFE